MVALRRGLVATPDAGKRDGVHHARPGVVGILQQVVGQQLHDLLQGETDGTIDNFLRIGGANHDVLEISSTGQFGSGGSADVTIKLENAGSPVDLSVYGSTSSEIVNSLIAGADPLVKVDHS